MKYLCSLFLADVDTFDMAAEWHISLLTVESIATVGCIDRNGTFVAVASSIGVMSDNISMTLMPLRLITFWWPSMQHTSSEEFINRSRRSSIGVGIMPMISMRFSLLLITNCPSFIIATSKAAAVNMSRRLNNGCSANYWKRTCE